MTQQLTLELAPPEPPSFANFLPGRNGEAIDWLVRLANGAAGETGLALWGAPGSGKSHLLRAAVAACHARHQPATYVPVPGALIGMDPAVVATQGLVAVDDADRAPDDAQARLFTLYNELRERGGHLLVAARTPVAEMPLREDLRTRLGWGLAYEVLALDDAEKPVALFAYARRRGFRLGDDVVQYLLAHGRRDMNSLLSMLAALDRHSLATKRAVTVPMVKAWLQRQSGS